MNCLLGDERQLEEKIATLIKFKIDLIDEEFTFGNEHYDLEYLSKLHKFLYGDVYDFAGEVRNEFTEIDLNEINEVIETLVLLSRNFTIELYEEFLLVLEYLKDIQIFKDGNKRTLYAFVKQLICAYRLPLELVPLSGFDDHDDLTVEGIKLK